MREWLVAMRKAACCSQKAICEAVGIAQPTYWEYEHGICTPSVAVAKKIGAYLGFDWTRFYDDAPINDMEEVG